MRFEWTDAAVEQLHRLWARGNSVDDIAVALGASSGSVDRKVRRLKLPKKRTDLMSILLAAEQPEAFKVERRGCMWPHGTPRTKDFRFCGEKALPGRSYCQEHFGVAYVKPKTKRLTSKTLVAIN